MTPDEIRAAIAADPALQALAQIRDDAAIAAALSQGRTKMVSVTTAEFASWAAVTNLRAPLEDISKNSTSPLRSSALAALDLLRGAGQTLDLSSSSVGQGNHAMLDAWVTAGIVSSGQRDMLYSMATIPDPVSTDAVSAALNGA